jgi:type VI secretion system secreted protein VgrG
MKTAARFAVIAGAGMTNTGLSVINGQVALSPTPALTGFPPGVISGTVDFNNAAAIQAETDCTSAYSYIQGLKPTSSLTGIDLGGKTLTPGTYNFASTAGISAGGILTLNGPGVYIFQVGSAITTGANSRIVLENGALAGCVYWQLGSSATFGASSLFLGNVLAYASATFGNAVTYDGTVCAHTGDVTLINNKINEQTGCTC